MADNQDEEGEEVQLAEVIAGSGGTRRHGQRCFGRFWRHKLSLRVKANTCTKCKWACSHQPFSLSVLCYRDMFNVKHCMQYHLCANWQLTSGVCLACSLCCHEGQSWVRCTPRGDHDKLLLLLSLSYHPIYSGHFRCDCGNKRFPTSLSTHNRLLTVCN